MTLAGALQGNLICLGIFAAMIYLLPFFTGAAADRVGFRRALLLAFALLALGYAGLGLFPGRGPVLLSLGLIMVGGSFVKPVIAGTVARSSNESSRARAFSLFYMMVNVGSFMGKALARPVRVRLGLSYIPLYSAGFALLALMLVLFFYFPKEQRADEERKDSATVLRDIQTVLKNGLLEVILPRVPDQREKEYEVPVSGGDEA